MSNNIAISIRDVSKKYRLFPSHKERLKEAFHPFGKRYHDEFWALKEVNLDIPKGQILGILGCNGSGKSTLLQIIASVLTPTTGNVTVSGSISALLELGAGFNPEFTGRDNVILNGVIQGLPHKKMVELVDEIEAFADIGDFFDQPVKTYSSGMFVRVAFAAAIHIDPDILVVDEALSVGDVKFQHRCFQRIREFFDNGKTVVIVSHDTDTLLRICDHGVVFDKGQLSYSGQIADAVNHYQNLLFGSSRKDAEAPSSPDKKAIPEKSMSAISARSDDRRDRVFEKPFYNKHESRLGNSSAKIIDFDYIADGVVNSPEIPAHADVEFIIKISFEMDVNNISVGFGLVTVDGTYVFGTNFGMMGAPLVSCKAGDVKTVTFKFRSNVTGGEYFLNLGCNKLSGGDDTFIDVRRSVARLKFSETVKQVGFVHMDIDYEVSPIESAVMKVA